MIFAVALSAIWILLLTLVAMYLMKKIRSSSIHIG